MMFLFAVLMAMVACGPGVEGVSFHVNKPGSFLRLLTIGTTFTNVIDNTGNGFIPRGGKFLFSIQAYFVLFKLSDEYYYIIFNYI